METRLLKLFAVLRFLTADDSLLYCPRFKYSSGGLMGHNHPESFKNEQLIFKRFT